MNRHGPTPGDARPPPPSLKRGPRRPPGKEDPSESAITVTLVGMRGGRRALPTTSWCISAVPWAVPCGALRGGGGEGVGGRLWCQPRTAGLSTSSGHRNMPHAEGAYVLVSGVKMGLKLR